MEQPYHSAMRYNSIILSEAAWTPDELLASIDGNYCNIVLFLNLNCWLKHRNYYYYLLRINFRCYH